MNHEYNLMGHFDCNIWESRKYFQSCRWFLVFPGWSTFVSSLILSNLVLFYSGYCIDSNGYSDCTDTKSQGKICLSLSTAYLWVNYCVHADLKNNMPHFFKYICFLSNLILVLNSLGRILVKLLPGWCPGILQCVQYMLPVYVIIHINQIFP